MPYAGRLADPNFRTDRAKKAGRARTNIDYFIRSIVERAPELTDDHRSRLAALLRPGGGQG